MENGEFWVIRNDSHKLSAISHLADIQPNQDDPIAIKIEPYKKKRSDLQNRFLWGWIYGEIERKLTDAGIVIHCDDGTEHPYTKEILHEIMKQKFLASGSIESKGRSLILYKSTSGLNKAQFSEFVENVRGFVYQFWNISIADPMSGYYKSLMEELR